MIIAVDTAGGDYAPQEIVKGAIEAASEYDLEVARWAINGSSMICC